MKKIFAALALAITSVSAFAQEEKPHFLSVNVGISSPIGDFADNKVSNDKSGFASNGVALNLEGAYFLNKTIGIGAKTGTLINSLDAQAYSDEISKMTPGFSNSVTTSSYRTSQLMVGPYINVPLNTVTIGFKAMAGLLSTSSPETTVRIYNDDISTTTISPLEISTSIGYDLGATMRYGFNDRLGLSLNADYIFGTQEYGTGSGAYEQPVSILSFTAGLSIRINR